MKPSLRKFIGKRLARTEFAEFVTELRKVLPGKIPREVLTESSLHLANAELTEELLEDELARLVGNLQRLQSFRAAVPWSRQVEPEYVPVQIVAGRYCRVGDQLGAEFLMSVLAGTPTGRTIAKSWTNRFCGAVSRRLGFGNYSSEYSYRDPLQLVNLRFYVLIRPELSRSGPDFSEIWQTESGDKIHPSYCYQYNRKLLRHRAGVGSLPCPEKYDRQRHPCHLCPVGSDRCVLAVHDETYVIRRCPKCKKESWFDPAVKRAVCVNCHRQDIFGDS